MQVSTTGTAIQTETLAARVERCFRELDIDGLAELYHPDVLLDANPPQWRFQVRGRDEIVAWYRRTLAQADDIRCEAIRTTASGDVIVVEWELHFGEGDDEHLVREVNLLRTDGQRIVEQTCYCTGAWDPETIARQRAEAPMVRGWEQ